MLSDDSLSKVDPERFEENFTFISNLKYQKMNLRESEIKLTEIDLHHIGTLKMKIERYLKFFLNINHKATGIFLQYYINIFIIIIIKIMVIKIKLK